MSDGSDLKSPQPTPAELAQPSAADDALPPVETPTMAFVTQLFLIPLLIVSVLFAGAWGLNWITTPRTDPGAYVADLENPWQSSGQSAYALAAMLRDPRNDAMKRDPVLCRTLATVLEEQIEEGKTSEHAINLRVFVCRALGEFYITGGLPALIKAVETERDDRELPVRRSAIAALTRLADNTDPKVLLADPDLLPALRDAASEHSTGSEDEADRGDLRSGTAFLLGVLGGKEALNELEILCDDGYPNARFNAANGLARHGDTRAARVLIEMLDPDNEDVVAGEDEETAVVWKRSKVMTNALVSITRLHDQNPDADLSEIEAAVARLATAELDPRIAKPIHMDAKELSQRLRQR